jgi:hypothetical protein
MSVSEELLPLSVIARYGIAKFSPFKIQLALYCLSVGFTASEVDSKLQRARRCVPHVLKELINFKFSIEAPCENIL